jgi:ribosomal protein S18 acetylase RimI-like enzyme
MKINEINEVTPILVEAFQKLIPQLSTSATIPNENDLKKIINASGTTMFVAEEQDKILGSLTLLIFQVPDGIRASIQSVVVDEDARGKGIGRSLCEAAIKKSQEEGAITIDLTTSSKREAANRLYQKLGFKKRETNVYRFMLE